MFKIYSIRALTGLILHVLIIPVIMTLNIYVILVYIYCRATHKMAEHVLLCKRTP